MQQQFQISRENFRMLATRCIVILKECGFPLETVNVDDQAYRSIEKCFFKEGSWFGSVEADPALQRSKPVRVSQSALDRTTLECAPFFIKSGAWHEGYLITNLDRIKFSLAGFLRESGYVIEEINPEERARVIIEELDSTWPCYKLYEEVARQCDTPKDEIALARSTAKDQYPKLYQE